MAKKKKRSVNIARKREKRRQGQKSRRKSLAIQKQQRSHSEKLGEERLHEMIVQSHLLVDEPEFSAITFDPDLMGQYLHELLVSNLSSVEVEIAADDSDDCAPEIMESEDETVGEQFRQKVLLRLITPEFIHEITHALGACETRLNRTGQRNKAEIAFVARSLFELADPIALIFHPLVLKISTVTLESLLNQPQFMLEERDAVQNLLSDVLDLSTTQESIDCQEHEVFGADTTDSDTPVKQDELSVDPTDEETSVPDISAEELPARALYQNSSPLKTRHIIEMWDGYKLVKDMPEQVEFVHPDLKRYITLTADRLLLQCTSMTDLEVAMEQTEKQCEPLLTYLAKGSESVLQLQLGLVSR